MATGFWDWIVRWNPYNKESLKFSIRDAGITVTGSNGFTRERRLSPFHSVRFFQVWMFLRDSNRRYDAYCENCLLMTDYITSIAVHTVNEHEMQKHPAKKGGK